MKLKCLYQESPRRQWTFCIIRVYFRYLCCFRYCSFDFWQNLHSSYYTGWPKKRRHEFKTAIVKVLMLKVRLCILISTFSLQNRLFNLGYLDLFWGSKKSWWSKILSFMRVKKQVCHILYDYSKLLSLGRGLIVLVYPRYNNNDKIIIYLNLNFILTEHINKRPTDMQTNLLKWRHS